jgi:uncharacterized OB-fold protein
MEIPRHWRLRAQRYRLEGSVCPICGQRSFPPRRVCPYCADQLVRIDRYGLAVWLASNKVFDASPLKG